MTTVEPPRDADGPPVLQLTAEQCDLLLKACDRYRLHLATIDERRESLVKLRLLRNAIGALKIEVELWDADHSDLAPEAEPPF